ncbi:MAG: methylmalonyl Co-A mutase-associated GTPase MeaB [Pseudomonadota bacterium]|nr:methylmalonyl Co-A mutase-associated GTPase MeaB [Pseudomonadota bacterium]
MSKEINRKVNLENSKVLVEGVKEGKIRAIARMISLAETEKPEHLDALSEIYYATGQAHVVGLTGVPGSGKSSLVKLLAKAIRETGRTVGIIAIDPSSPFSGGAILGDRIRMTNLTGDDGIFIRSMATRGEIGGLARASLDAVDILDAAGFNVILLETVGVGQDEIDIMKAAHSVAVISAPGLGDDVQAIKAGILEIADIHVVSKCDRPDANKTILDIKGMLALGKKLTNQQNRVNKNFKQINQTNDSVLDWNVNVIATSAETGVGVIELLKKIDEHAQYLSETGLMDKRRRDIIEMRVIKNAEDIVRQKFKGKRKKIDLLIDSVVNGAMPPRQAAEELLKNFKH